MERQIQPWKWGSGRCDARGHSLFQAFRQHLADQPCWAVLEELEASYRIYEKECQRAYGVIFEELKRRLANLRESDARAMAESLLLDWHYAVTGSSQRLQFSYEPKSMPTEEGIRYYLQLGRWGVGYEENPEVLQPMARVHRELVDALPLGAELRALVEADMMVRRAMKESQVPLSPDARLRKLVLAGAVNSALDFLPILEHRRIPRCPERRCAQL